MHAILNLGPFLSDRVRLTPLSEQELAEIAPAIEAELDSLRQDIRARYPAGLRAASISEATWLMDRMQELSLPARRFLAFRPTWI